MLPIINLGPLSLPVPPFVLILGLWLGSSLVERQAKKGGRNSQTLSNVIWISLLAGILGARLSFIARNPSAFQGQLGSVLSLNPALLDLAGGLLIALVAGYIVASRNQEANWALLNDLVPFFAVLASSIFLSNFASGAGYGTLTNLPWGIELWGGNRHPVQLYYFVFSLLTLYLSVFKGNLLEEQPGPSLWSFVIYTSGYLTILSAFQDPAGKLIGGFRVFQLVSWFVFTSSLIILNRFKIKEVKNAAF